MTYCPASITPVRKIARCTPEPFKKSVAYGGFMARQIFLAALIAAPAFAGNTQGSPFRFGPDCYGPTLDAVFPAPSPSAKATAMSVPTEYVMIVQLSDGPDLFGDSPCHREPLAIRQLYAWLWEVDLENETVEHLLTEGVKVREVRLLATHQGEVDFGVARQISQVEIHGIERPDGFGILESKEGNGLFGLYRFPAPHTDPSGDPVSMSCDIGCEVAYQISPALFLRYRILNVKRQPVTPAWIEIDRAVRATVMSWINEG